jgi:ribosomal protein S18 acetylase RimI-like enzyme
MTDGVPGFTIRRAVPEDHAALTDICLKTGDLGEDGTHLQDDPDLLGLVYALPYQVFAPDFAFVAEDTAGVCGYVLGVPDTRAFDDWMDRVWYPPLRARLRNPGPDEFLWRGSDWVRRRVFAPVAGPHFDLTRYPAHGHIDLLPRARGKGLGREMMARLGAALARAGAPGMYLEVGHENVKAQAFYRRIGFDRLDSRPDAVIMGKVLTREGSA